MAVHGYRPVQLGAVHPPVTPPLTPATLTFLRALLDRVTLQVSDPNFRRDALSTITAIEELDEAILCQQRSSTLSSESGQP
jgi:hypothetical protein